jgi:hypothetical protein
VRIPSPLLPLSALDPPAASSGGRTTLSRLSVRTPPSPGPTRNSSAPPSPSGRRDSSVIEISPEQVEKPSRAGPTRYGSLPPPLSQRENRPVEVSPVVVSPVLELSPVRSLVEQVSPSSPIRRHTRSYASASRNINVGRTGSTRVGIFRVHCTFLKIFFYF